jgi:hypothetical protein
MKILVTGSREWTDLVIIISAIQYVVEHFGISASDLEMVEGECRGADKCCRVVAEQLGIKVIPEPAQWKKYGKAAGPIRNQRMLDVHPDIKLCLAFHDTLDGSRGTKDMVNRCKKAGIPVWLFKTNSTTPAAVF